MFFTPTAFYKITLPPGYLPAGSLTKIISSQCGSTLGSIDEPIQAIPVFRAVRYEFDVDDGAISLVIPKSTSYFSLNEFPGGGVLNTPYTIRVRSSNAPAPAAFTAWGDYCVVTTPAS